MGFVQEIAESLQQTSDPKDAARMVMAQVRLLEAGTYLRAVTVEDDREIVCPICDAPFREGQATLQNEGKLTIHAECLNGQSPEHPVD